MKKIIVPSGVYLDLINLLGKWKILDLKDMLSLSQFDLKYDNLAHKVRRLEKSGFLKSINEGFTKKQLYLTNKGLKFTPFDTTGELGPVTMHHDLLAGRVLRTLNQLDNFKNPRMFHELEGGSPEPDATIEFELHQKTKQRVKMKYSVYCRSNFDFIYLSL